MVEFLHQLSSGLALGGVYAVTALALVMIFQATQLVNFAQGEMAMFSTYVAWQLLQNGWSYWAAFAVTVIVSFLGGVVIERAIVRPFANAPVLASVIVFIGLGFIFNALAGFFCSAISVQSFDTPFDGRPWFGNKFMSAHESGSVVVSLIVLALVFAFFRLDAAGAGDARGGAEPRVRAAGRRARRLDAGAGLGAGGGDWFGGGDDGRAHRLSRPQHDERACCSMRSRARCWEASTIRGAPWLGGFAVGIAENLLGAYVVGQEVKLSVALVIIIGVLVVRPSGLFGRRIVARV